MKSKLAILSALILTITLFGFQNNNEIGKCFISFTTATNLTSATPDRLPETSVKVRTVKTESGEVEVTRIDGYRVIYNNDKKSAFCKLEG